MIYEIIQNHEPRYYQKNHLTYYYLKIILRQIVCYSIAYNNDTFY